LLDLVVQPYAPLPAASLKYLCRLLRDGAPHLAAEVGQSTSTPNPVTPTPRSTAATGSGHRPRIPWRFQFFWGWEHKLEAYVPAHKRRMGLYAMPMLWGDQILGWANLKVVDGRLQHELGFAGARPRGSAFWEALDEALQRMQEFLGL
jgi:hypothetical protein